MWECVSAIGVSATGKSMKCSEVELEGMRRFAGYVTLDGILFPFVIDDATNIEEAFGKFSSAYQKAIAKKSIVVPGRSGFQM